MHPPLNRYSRYTKNSTDIGELDAIFVASGAATGTESESLRAGTATGNGHDNSGFDWANGVQNDPEELDREWAKIKADHAARRMR